MALGTRDPTEQYFGPIFRVHLVAAFRMKNQSQRSTAKHLTSNYSTWLAGRCVQISDVSAVMSSNQLSSAPGNTSFDRPPRLYSGVLIHYSEPPPPSSLNPSSELEAGFQPSSTCHGREFNTRLHNAPDDRVGGHPH